MKIRVSRQLIIKILAQYQLKLKKIYNTETGYRNTVIPVKTSSNKKIALVFFKDEPQILKRIKNSNLVSQALAEKNFPTRWALNPPNQPKNTILKLNLSKNKNKKIRYVCLYPYLPGKTIEWEAYTQKHIKLLGQVMSHVHYQLKLLESENNINTNQLATTDLSQLNKIMELYFEQQAVKLSLAKKLKLRLTAKIFSRNQQLINCINTLKTSQVLHMDFVRSNILFGKLTHQQLQAQRLTKFALDPQANKNLTITGILDWEKTSYGPKIIDLARTLSFLLVDCKYKTDQKVRKYFLHSGYRKRGPAVLTNLKLLNPLIKFFWLFDFYKFLAHNPYQFLNQNEHFVRTRKKLLETKVLIEVE